MQAVYSIYPNERNALFEQSSHIVQQLPPGKLHSSSDPILIPYSPSLLSPSPSFSTNQARSNPNPFIQARYLVTISAHAACGSLAVENSMHSSRAAFSSLHTQQGLTLGAPSSPGGLFEEARLLIWEEALAVRGGLGVSWFAMEKGWWMGGWCVLGDARPDILRVVRDGVWLWVWGVGCVGLVCGGMDSNV